MNKSLRIVTFYYVASLLDVFTTIIGVFGLGAAELNPVYLHLGWTTALLIKLTVIPLVCYFLIRRIEIADERGYSGAATWLRFTWLFPIEQWLVVVWNAVQIAILAGQVVV